MVRFSGIIPGLVAAAALVSSPSPAGAFWVPLPALHVNAVQAVPASGQDASGREAISTGATRFVRNMADRGLAFLSTPDMTREARRKEFRSLLLDSFDLNTISRFALGTYWRLATPEQRETYQKLFEDMVVEVYSRRFSEYQGQKFQVVGNRPEGVRDTIVKSVVISPNESDVRVDWRVRHKNGQYKVVDVLVEGVSMSITQRSDFASVIERGGGRVEVLIDHLRK